MKINWKSLIISLVISLGIGFFAGFLTQNSMEVFEALKKPPLAPPGLVFPIVWTILYSLMGISAYLVYEAEAPQRTKEKALSIYGFQLLFNFLWSIVFFNFGNIYWPLEC
nr:TspO/MBR family protein [Sporanaerobium hydrogeniformans]